MRNKIFLFFAALCCTFHFSAQAAIVDGTCGPNLTWSLNTADSTLTISGTGNMTNYTSPDGAPWKTYSVNVKYVVIEDGVTSIGSRAFYHYTVCSVAIGNDVTSIGDYAFYYCDGLISVTIPNSVTSIGRSAFSSCSSLSSVIIGNNVTSIGSSAFEHCTSLLSVTIPNSVTGIGSFAFQGCSKLTSVTIDNSVTSIGEGAFSGCNHLTSFVFGSSVTSIRTYAFQNCSSLTSIEIPNSVTSIGEYAFSGCSGLTSIEIPSSISRIEDKTFEYCCGLNSVTIPNSVTRIGIRAFSGCSNLTSVIIPNNVTSIGEGAFSSCSNLTSVIIPNSVTSLGSLVFSNCNGLKLITNYNEVPLSINSNVFNNVDKNTCMLCVPEESVILYQNASVWNEFYKIRPIGSALAVQFVDWNETVLSTDYVISGEAATAPANPSREGYTFTGWDEDFSNVTEDLTVTALYEINSYRVRFYDWDGTLLKTDSADWQSAAVAPANPTRAGYTFIGWDKSFDVITADLDITALYEKEQLNVTVSYIDGVENNLLDTEGIVLTLPDVPEFAGFTFLRWETVAANIENGITIQAVYEANEPTYAPVVYTNPANLAQKLIRNGNVYILTEEKEYTIDGRKVR